MKHPLNSGHILFIHRIMQRCTVIFKPYLNAGVIRASESPFLSPFVVVKTKNCNIRLCVDYRRLNMQMIKDAYALPNLEELFYALIGAQWFSVMDPKSGYYQIEMEDSDKLFVH